MGNIESTAVNELIELVQGGQKPVKDADDLMFSPPKTPPAIPKQPTRMTATVPPTNAAGDVAPLPRLRSPVGTQTISSLPPAVRVSTAPPARAVSIPPLAGETMKSIGAPPPPVPSAAMRDKRSTLPPPLRKTTVGVSVEGTPAPERLSPPPPRLTAPQPSATHTAPPPTLPVAAPFDAPPPFIAPPAPPTMLVAPPIVAAPPPPVPPPAPVDMTSNQAWFETSQQVAAVEDENWVGTSVVQKPVQIKSIVGKLVVPMTLLVIAGVFIGGYFAFDGEGGHPKTAAAAPSPAAKAAVAPAAVVEPAKTEPAPVAAVEPAVAAHAGEPAPVEPAKTEPAPVEPAKSEPAPSEPAKAEAVAAVAPAPVTPPNIVAGKQPGLVDVRIDSTPSGATVMLVDRGKTSFLGTTPVSAAIDPTRQYDLVFTYENKPTQIEHLDPRTMKRMAVTLGKHGSAVEAVAKHEETPAPRRVEAPAPKHTETPKKAEKAKLVEPAFDAPKKAVAAPAAAGGDGTLMISSKPPCEIFVDGKSTGLTTPQRAIPLAAGTHKITLVNSEKSIKKTVAVQISANKTEKVIQDLMK